ncbi:MAG: type II toxin-antitoxin system ParD family antitoxin [Mesorhizobium sp.]|uniref:type II toxin-antitoxin system ParD family antitoxin n=1 Tax=Mesorhizobium sp. TaxID=1871066 RepID=UPI000FE5CE6F|nr:type II toxin-antitoxin system ParD family antitoxin [Mesorhizobium sp.]RWH77256.1 MAG: type II toxin-antitoxin system ParD family antitoxin [Mesorhizobium sp.]RWH77466.1 MAG: type II toxin-antitoxin system ParD family antitoxin [Mesorhizobium sp.]RWH87930.1 MAG: type II toxin-antitoxin system ParD family antitoxin [Mesorhizobium sp.]RWH95970.1 MAG: type II toxin-antitoxin system ParD family antitoxin [Mesorhizobium sp.]RWH98151.1 MAG: type II toxin-antitoxin system ParD family antitoxin [M
MPSTYNIGAHYETLVRELVGSGRYASASEVLRDSLRLLEEREAQRKAKLAALRDEIRAGIESGPGIPADAIFDRLEAKYSGGNRK